VQNSLKTLTLSLGSALLTALPSVAANPIIMTYGPWRGSIRVESLETFAKEGTINSNLGFYLRRVSREQQDGFRDALVKRIEVSPVLLSRFFNSPIGEDILTRVGRGITIQGGRNGKYALRAAIVQAAFEPEGLTLLNVLRKLPTNIQLQGEFIFELSNRLDHIVQATNFFTHKMAQLSAQAAQSSSVNFSQLPDLRLPGKFNVRKETFTLTDSPRKRTFYVILYVPQTWRTGKTPVVILSHGLASRPEDFEGVAQHLASYGYVVAIPQHLGSDTQRKQALFNGLSRDVFDLDEFIDRPKDISAVIDELERRNQTEFDGRLDLENVGVAGHSFGGYTALAIAGAEIDFDYLESVCDRPFRGLNISLFLQCRALSLPRQFYQFRDARVKAVLAENPFYSAIFGQKGLVPIQIPVAILGGNFDPATPFALEQVSAFTWLTTANKYLGLKEGQAHINLSQIDAGITQVLDALPQLELAESDLLDSYLNPTIIAFFEVYIAKNERFRPYLTSAYGEYLSQNQAFKFYWIDSSSQPALQQALKDF
jgi:predicted dienelactone hydrolase